jgi:hypothetical protein
MPSGTEAKLWVIKDKRTAQERESAEPLKKAGVGSKYRGI